MKKLAFVLAILLCCSVGSASFALAEEVVNVYNW